MLISLREYAEKNGRSPISARGMAERGGFKTALKIGKNWVIDSEEPYPDRRKKDQQKRGKKRNPYKRCTK